MSSMKAVTLFSLPIDILRSSFSCLRATELAALALTCKTFLKLSEDVVRDILVEIQRNKFPLSLSLSPMKAPPAHNLTRFLHILSTNQIYTLGGAFHSDEVNCFLPSFKRWYISAEMRRERDSFDAVALRGYLVAISGAADDATATTEIFSPFENTWIVLPSLPKKIRSGAAVTINDTIVVIGGVDAQRDSSVTSAFSLALDFSTPMPLVKALQSTAWMMESDVLLESRYAHSAVVFNNEIWVAGGTTPNEDYSTSVETLVCCKGGGGSGCIKSGSSMPSMTRGRRNFQLLVAKGKLYAVGGDEECTIESYNVSKEEWEFVSSIPTYRQNFAATSDGEFIYIFGGQSRRRQFLNTWDCFDVALETWSKTSIMPANGSVGFSHGAAMAMNFGQMTW